MEYVEGTTLQDLMKAKGPVDFAHVVGFATQVAAGLAHAHARGFVHRDVKPSNLIVTPHGQVKILDMGLARSVEDPNDELTANADNPQVVGTADYLAPEQALGEHTDARTDIYSLGATLYALVTGAAPFTGTTAQKLLQHQIKDPVPLDTLRANFPPAVAEIVARMMAKNPDDRYQTADEVIDAFRPWLPADGPGSCVVAKWLTSGDLGTGTGTGSKTRTKVASRHGPKSGPKSRAVRPARRPARRKGWLIPAAAAAVLGLAGAVWAVSGTAKPRPQPNGVAAALAPAAAPAASTPAVDRSRFVKVSIAAAATVSTDRPMFYDRPTEVIVPDRWGEWVVHGVPFDLIDPRGGTAKNAIALQSTVGVQTATAPAHVALPVRSRAAAVHLLGLVGGWCWPHRPGNRNATGETVMVVRLAYADGQVEEHPLRNGEHVADYIRRHDVPDSEFAFHAVGGQQVRYLALRPRRDAEIAEVQFVKGTPAEAAPVTFAVTVERPAR
jgi:hypothetical protein